MTTFCHFPIATVVLLLIYVYTATWQQPLPLRGLRQLQLRSSIHWATKFNYAFGVTLRGMSKEF